MSSLPATLDAPFSFVSFSGSTSPQLVLDDGELLTGAASVWAALKFAQTSPATPETYSDMKRAETLFLAELEKVGLSQSDIERRLSELRRVGARGAGSPLAG